MLPTKPRSTGEWDRERDSQPGSHAHIDVASRVLKLWQNPDIDIDANNKLHLFLSRTKAVLSISAELEQPA